MQRCKPNLGFYLILIILLCAIRASAAVSDDLLAHFKLNGTPDDSAGKCPRFELTNAPFIDGSLFCNGCYENSGVKIGYRAVARVPGLSYDKFTVSLDFYALDFNSPKEPGLIDGVIYTVARGHAPSSLQRKFSSHDSIIVAGESYRWFGLRCISNRLEMTMNNQSFSHTLNAQVEPKRWHNIIASFDMKARRILVTLDGRVVESFALPTDFKLVVGDSSHDRLDKAFSLQNYSNGSVFYGFVNNLKVFSRPFSEVEMLSLYAADEPARRLLRATTSGSGDEILIYAAGIVVVLVGGFFLWRLRYRKRVHPLPAMV